MTKATLPWHRKLYADYAAARDYTDGRAGWDETQIPDTQLQKLKRVWDECVNHVPYYRSLVRDGLAPDKINQWDDFRAIPELNRTILQQRAGEFTRLSGPPDMIRMTGGSTGTPVRIGMWKSEDQVLRRLKLALWARVGYTPDSSLFLIWGHAHLLGTGWRRWWNHAVRKAKDWAVGYERVDAYSLSPDYCRSIAKKLIAFRPAGLIGYASALDYFVRSTEEFHPQFRRLGLRFVMPCAEPPPKPDTLPLLRDVFGCSIVQEFGGVDFGQIAMKIDDGRFEVFSDFYVLEAHRNDAEPPDSGAVVVTALYPRYTPLIRYRQGDLVAGARRLSNGHVQSFQELAGRENEMVHLPGGASIHSLAFLHCIHAETAVLNGQLVVSDREIVLRLVTLSSHLAECEKRIRHRLGQLAPELAGIPIIRVQDVETSIAGKRRWLVDKRTRTSA